MNTLRVVLAGVMGLLGCLGVQPAWAALVEEGPGSALVVDGGDNDTDVTFKIVVTGLLAGYEFGFMEDGTFVPIALSSNGQSPSRGSVTFDGGSMVTFALRYDPTGTIYTMADPADFAARTYSSPGNSRDSAGQGGTADDGYRTLTLDWNLNGNGFDPLSLQGLTVALTAMNPHDGLAPGAAPVPLPSSILFFSTGLFGLVAWRRRQRRCRRQPRSSSSVPGWSGGLATNGGMRCDGPSLEKRPPMRAAEGLTSR